MTAAVANLAELYVAPGGPIYRLMQRVGIAGGDRGSVLRRILLLLLLTWVPMCLFGLAQGVALGVDARSSLLLDFGTYARFFIALPILVVAETIVGPRLTMAGQRFVEDGLVRPADYPAFEQAIARLASRRESIVATLVILALAAIGAWKFTYESASGVGMVGWRSVALPDGSDRLNLAALWSNLVAVPVLLFLWYRWLWRIATWGLFLRDVSRLDLRLSPAHADRAGGLGFLEVAHASFGILAFAAGCVLSAEAAFRVVYEGTTLDFFQANTLVLLGLMLLLFLGPLLVFMPVMARARRAALLAYGSLVIRYNRAFTDKWVDGRPAADEPLLGTSDIQSLADLGNSFRFVDEMRITPFGSRSAIQFVVATLLPALPLPLLAVPLSQILDALAKVAL